MSTFVRFFKSELLTYTLITTPLTSTKLVFKGDVVDGDDDEDDNSEPWHSFNIGLYATIDISRPFCPSASGIGKLEFNTSNVIIQKLNENFH